jgi:hypothetical protein
MFGLSPEALIALLNGLFTFATWAVELARDIIARHQPGAPPISAEDWAKWDAEALAAHTDVQRPRVGPVV